MFRNYLVSLFAVVFLFGCAKNPVEPGEGKLMVHLFGSSPVIKSGDKAPPIGEVQHIWLTLLEVSAYSADGQWEINEITNGTYDFLALMNGVMQPLGIALTPGSYTEMRLVVDSVNSIVVDGVECPLKIPSGEQTGVKISINFDVIAGEAYDILIDFDVGKSITKRSGGYILRPHYNAYKKVLCGKVYGKTTLAGETAVSSLVKARSVADTALSTSTISMETGEYEMALKSGDYVLQAEKQASDTDTSTVRSAEQTITVKEGQETTADIVF